MIASKSNRYKFCKLPVRHEARLIETKFLVKMDVHRCVWRNIGRDTAKSRRSMPSSSVFDQWHPSFVTADISFRYQFLYFRWKYVQLQLTHSFQMQIPPMPHSHSQLYGTNCVWQAMKARPSFGMLGDMLFLVLFLSELLIDAVGHKTEGMSLRQRVPSSAWIWTPSRKITAYLLTYFCRNGMSLLRKLTHIPEYSKGVSYCLTADHIPANYVCHKFWAKKWTDTSRIYRVSTVSISPLLVIFVAFTHLHITSSWLPD